MYTVEVVYSKGKTLEDFIVSTIKNTKYNVD